MPTPREVFEHPDKHWAFITVDDDAKFESDSFDRKEAMRPNANGQVNKNEFNKFIEEGVMPTVSAFANSNFDGGLLVVGVSTKGEVKGIGHLSDEQRQSLAGFNDKLCGHSARVRTHECADATGAPQRILLIYVPYSFNYICETVGANPRFWIRKDNKKVAGDEQMRDQIRRDKKVVDFESTYCCPFRPQEVDEGVVQEFRRAHFGQDAPNDHEQSDEEFLYNIGALIYDADNNLAWNNAGCLFFNSNPQRVLAHAKLRLLRFEVRVEDYPDRRGAPTFDKSFSGPISTQIRQARRFLQDAAYFRTLPLRNPEGGFSDDSEYPFEAVDEAIVNAMAHRDYGVSLPVECEAYIDGLMIHNAGRIIQRSSVVPDDFTLRDVRLTHLPRNSKLLDWLKAMKDERGSPFVKAVAEGTKTMLRRMEEMNLPAPTYHTGDTQTIVTLFNNEAERKALLKFLSAPASTEFSNLFPLDAWHNGVSIKNVSDSAPRSGQILEALNNKLKRQGWYVHAMKFSRLVVSRKGMTIGVPHEVAQVARFFPSFALGVRYYWGRYYLCADYSPKVRNTLRMDELLTTFSPTAFTGHIGRAHSQRWRRCKLLESDGHHTLVRFFDSEQEEWIEVGNIIPEIPIWMMQQALDERGVRFDLARAVKEHSLSLRPGTARTRFDKIQAVVSDLAQTIFPLNLEEWNFGLSDRPSALRRQGELDEAFQTRTLPEPQVEFSRQKESSDIRDGITRFGSYSHEPKRIEIVPITTPAYRDAMAALIVRLQQGKFRYRGAERTFGTQFTYSSIVSVPSPENILAECQRLVLERPEWNGREQLDRAFLVHTPELGYSSDDENSPYYTVKRFLLERGLPCQMVDTPTLQNADYKDLNLALNLTAKCGITPWVLPDEVPDADFFIGLSYTQAGRRGQERLMGYANVFNRFGRWQFYSGSTQTFPYSERARYLGDLARDTLGRLSDQLQETPNISFHYSAKFGHEDRQAIVDAARQVRPNGTYSFVSINTHHDVRLFDSRPETDGSLSRGSYVITSPSQILLSTTGHNPYRKALGTPQMLEITARVERPRGIPEQPIDLRILAIQILNLTKLNWASTDSMCGEPITIKYASDIAYLTAAFLRQKSEFQLHPVLENTPWFI